MPGGPGLVYGTTMYVVELSFDGDPRRLAARPAHRQVLARLHAEGHVIMAGPWADDSGALLVLRVDSEAAVHELLAEDPYYSTPGVTVASVRAWTPAVGTS